MRKKGNKQIVEDKSKFFDERKNVYLIIFQLFITMEGLYQFLFNFQKCEIINKNYVKRNNLYKNNVLNL